MSFKKVDEMPWVSNAVSHGINLRSKNVDAFKHIYLNVAHSLLKRSSQLKLDAEMDSVVIHTHIVERWQTAGIVLKYHTSLLMFKISARQTHDETDTAST